MTRSAEDAVRGLWQTLSDRDWDGLADFLTDDCLYVDVPTGPGLGVELDRDRLAELHEQWVTCGVRRREDTVYMRSIEPGFEVNTSRW